MNNRISIVILAVTAASGFGQARTVLLDSIGKPRPAFEAASVKVTAQHNGVRLDRATYTDDASLLSFIVMAYGLNSCGVKASMGLDCPLISGALPAWAKASFPPAGDNLFEIRAALPASAGISSGYTAAQVREGEVVPLSQMLQLLLEDRFHLRVHLEMKELPVYALTVGKGGAKLQATRRPQFVDAIDGTSIELHGQSAFNPVLAPDGSRTGRRRITFQSSSLPQVAASLTVYMDRPVLDRTDLQGNYDFKLEYEVDPDAANRGGSVAAAIFSGLTCSGLSAALQDVGLRCESAKGAVEVLVIDHVEKPSEN